MDQPAIVEGTIEEMDGRKIYCRTRSPKREELEEALLKLYGLTTETHVAFVFPSGMSAISTVMHAFATKDKHIVLGNELYCDTPSVAKWLHERGQATGVKVLNPDGTTQGEPEGNAGVVFVETCSNPSGFIPNYAAIEKLAGSAVVCLDNTWLTSAIWNPWAAGVPCDIVVESMSKYLSAGQCIGGMCIATKEHAGAIFSHIRHHGLHVPSQVCEAVLRVLPTLNQRVSAAQQRAERMHKAIAEMGLEVSGMNQQPVSPPVFTVTFALPHALINAQIVVPQKQNKKVPDIPSKKKQDWRFKEKVRDELERLCTARGIRFETSFGAAHSKIDSFPKVFETSVRLRVAAGYADDDSESKILKFFEEINGC